MQLACMACAHFFAEGVNILEHCSSIKRLSLVPSQEGEEAFKDLPLPLRLQMRQLSTELSTNGISRSAHIGSPPHVSSFHVKIPPFQRESLRELFEAEQEGKALRLEFIQEVNDLRRTTNFERLKK